MRLQNNIRIWIRTWPQDFAFMDNGTAPTMHSKALKKIVQLKALKYYNIPLKT